ncbi:MAG: FtsX-like permease family protein [Peptostreptococcaceae bacterium]
MLFKLSSRNVKRSMRDYSVYFLTLALGVCIFYVFNSLESQTVMLDLSESKKQYVEIISQVINIVSGFVSCILGFLVIYANNFIIKKRNKEFGIYMTLGISKNKISLMLFLETLLIGILSLIVGIFIGVFLSQGLAGITAKLFQTDMTKYQFVFSKEACLKSAFYFGIMFFVVMLLNFAVVSRYNLIDLINGDKKNQKLKGTNLTLSFILLILSVMALGNAYKFIIEAGVANLNGKEFNKAILLGIIGTVLFFRALAGFLIKVTQSSKNYYLKNLNTFTLRQLNSKVNTHYISMSVICLMLFIAIGMSSTGIGMKKTLEGTVDFQTPFDMSLNIEVKEDKDNIDIENYFMENGIDLNKYYSEKVEYNLYDDNISFKKFFEGNDDPYLKKQLDIMMEFNIPVIKVSDYNKLNKMQDKKEVDLKGEEVVLLTNVASMQGAFEYFINNNDVIKINNNEFKVKKEYEYNAIETCPMGDNITTLIVNDDYAYDMKLYKKYFSFNYKGDKLKTEEAVLKDFEDVTSGINKNENMPKVSGITRLMCYDNNMALANIFLFVGIYIGIVFLIASAAVLALSQLSGATESANRYKVLRKLGVSSEMINKSIFIQVLLYFMLPIGLALVHSIYGIRVANDFIKVFGDYDMVGTNLQSVFAILVVYGIYFVATYNGYKRVVESC